MTNQELHLGLEQDHEGVTTLTLMPNPSNERGGVVVLDEWLLDQIGTLLFQACTNAAADTGAN